MHVRCPQCQLPIEIVEDDSLRDLPCPSCGSSINLLDCKKENFGTTAVYHQNPIQTLGHFELGDQLGQGQFGSVYKATDTKLDRTVAVKVPRRDQVGPEEAEQFFREARAAAQLRHPNIVSVHEIGSDEGSIYIVSDFVDGIDLAEWLTGIQLTPRKAAELCAKITEALHHAHDAGVIHRDLKPSNIMMDSNGEPHIMDFGLAKREAGEITMTVQGKILGTPAYMSPEQALGDSHSADRRSDIYSLGAILYELLTGERPFQGTTRMLLHQVINQEATSPRKLNRNLPRDLETICLRCLEKDPAKRFQTAEELALELKRFLDGEPIQSRPIGRAARTWRWCRRNPVTAGLFGIIAGLLLVFSALTPVLSSHQAKLQKDSELARTTAERALAYRNRERAKADAARKSLLKYREVVRQAGERTRDNTSPCMAVAFSPNGKTLAFGKVNRKIKLWRIESRQVSLEIVAHQDQVNDLSYSPDGQLIASASNDGTVRIWNSEDGDLIHTLRGHVVASKVCFTADSKKVITCGNGNRNTFLLMWNVLTGEQIGRFEGHTAGVKALSYSKDGGFLVSSGFDTSIRMWNVDTFDEQMVFTGHSGKVNGLSISADKSSIASTSIDGTVRIWDIASGEEKIRFDTGPDSHFSFVQFSPDGKSLCRPDLDGRAVLQTLDEKAPRSVVVGSAIAQNAAFSLDGKWLATASSVGEIRLLDAKSGNLIALVDESEISNDYRILTP